MLIFSQTFQLIRVKFGVLLLFLLVFCFGFCLFVFFVLFCFVFVCSSSTPPPPRVIDIMRSPRNFMKSMFNIRLHSDVYGPISFTHGTSIHCDISLNDLDHHPRSQGFKKREAQTLLGMNYAKEVTVKKSCKCDEYGSFEHLLFLFLHLR